MEQFYINFFKSDERDFGYNLTSGGSSVLDPEQKKERVEKLKRWRENNPEIAQKSISAMRNYWKEHPQEKEIVLKKATSAAQDYWSNHPKEKEMVLKKMHEKAKEKNIKPVLCIETEEVYESAREADRRTGIKYYNIGKACNGQLKTAGGYHWAFYNKEDFLK